MRRNGLLRLKFAAFNVGFLEFSWYYSCVVSAMILLAYRFQKGIVLARKVLLQQISFRSSPHRGHPFLHKMRPELIVISSCANKGYIYSNIR